MSIAPRQPRPRRPVRAKHDDKKRAGDGLTASLQGTVQGLEMFLQSLQKSGMVEGLDAYRDMQRLLVVQRLWAENNGARETAPEFRAIAGLAGQLHEVFAGYAEVMKKLSELDKLHRVRANLDAELSPVRPKHSASKTRETP